MASLIARRLLAAIPTLFVIIAVAFFMMRLAPGGPFDDQRRVPPEIEANLKKAYNLDSPLPVQFVKYVGGLLRGDFGPSFKNKDFTVAELIGSGLPVSALLGALAIMLAILVGVPLGTLAALKQNSALDHAAMGTAMAGITIPNYVTAPLLTLLFGVVLGVLPVGGWNGGAPKNLVLPVVTLALPQIAILSRLMRASMIEVLHSNFIRTARAKGLPWSRVLLRHAMPAALAPLVSYLGPAVAALVTGSLVIETIFGLPGIGRYFVDGALQRDYTLVMGVVVIYASLIIFLNLLADVLYAVLDPRVRPA